MSFRLLPTTPPPAATPIGPAGAITEAQPAYSWNEETTATWYYLWIDDSGGNLFHRWYAAVNAGCTGGTCSVTPALMLGNGAYRWWVQTWNPSGSGPWSSATDFSVSVPAPGQPTLVSPEGATPDTTPTFTWNVVSGATWYHVWVNDVEAGDTTVLQKWISVEVNADCTGGNCTFDCPQTLAAGNYRWWIRAWNDSGTGPWSSPNSFTVQ